ncbi:MAG: NYN domain-containing protein [Desulfovibrio sp.]|jgi:uncharacterized LabA/DUF88 family protein|nr:NYN domain-containing protein [Desulfovibrio sp.]
MPADTVTQKALFLFDGPNFYKNLKSGKIDRGHLNFRKLAENLSMGRTIVDVVFFTSPVDQSTDAENYKSQQKFFAALEKSGVTLCKGNLVTRRVSCRKCRAAPIICKNCDTPLVVKEEKSVDVQLAMTMVTRCMDKNYDVLYLASCDSDLVPAINFVRNCGRQVFLLLPLNAKGYAVGAACNTTICIDQQKINAAQNI